MEKIERIRAVANMAENGEGNEARVARKKLAMLLDKYGVTLAEISAEEKREYAYKYRTKEEKKLICQIVFMVLGHPDIRYYQGDRELIFELTRADGIDIARYYNHWRPQLRQAIKNATSAFIMANDIYGKSNGEIPEPTPEEREQARRAAQMAAGIPKSRPYKELPGR